MYQATFSSATLTESEIDSSMLSSSVPRVQKKIEQQSRLVEEFLCKHQSQQRDPEAYKLLESLFTLFKTELNMNTELRNAIINEKNHRRRSELDTSNMYVFFKELSRLSGEDVSSFGDAVQVFISLKQKHLGKRKHFSKESQQLKEENIVLHSKIEILQNKLSQVSKQVNNDDEDFQKISQKLNSIKSQNEKYRSNLSEANTVIDSQEKCISCLRNKCNMYCETIDQMKEEIQELKEEIHHLQVEKRSTQKDAQDCVEKSATAQAQIEKENKVLGDKLCEVEDLLESERQKNSQIQAENGQLQQEYFQAEDLLQKAIKKIAKLKEKNEGLKEQISAAIEHSKEKYSKQMDKALTKQRKLLETKITETETISANNSKKVDELTNELEKYSQDSKNLRDVISSTEEKNIKLKKVIAEYKQENERLRNLMRQQSSENSENEQIIQAFEKIKDLLHLGHSSPQSIINKVESLLFKHSSTTASEISE